MQAGGCKAPRDLAERLGNNEKDYPVHSYHVHNYTKDHAQPSGFAVVSASHTDLASDSTKVVVWYSLTRNDTAVRQTASSLFADTFALDVAPDALSYTLAA